MNVKFSSKMRKRVLINFLFRHKVEIILILFSINLIYYFRELFVVNQDTYGYMRNMLTGSMNFIQFGRLGYIYFFGAIWHILHKLFSFPFSEFYKVIINFNIIFAALTVSLTYLVTKAIWRQNLLAFGSAAILLFSKSLIRFGGSEAVETMMIFFILLSYFFYIMAFRKKKILYFYLAAFIFGCAFEIKEAALFSILFFPAFTFSELAVFRFNLKQYFIYLLVLLFTAFLGPCIVYLKQGNSYIYNFILTAGWIGWKHIFHPWLNMLNTIRAVQGGFGNLFLPALGFLILFFRKKYNDLLILLALLAPIALLYFCGLAKERHYLVGNLGLAPLTAFLLFYISIYCAKFINIRAVRYFFLTTLLFLIAYNSCKFYKPLLEEKKYSQEVQNYGLRLIKDFPNNTVFLIGYENALMDSYFIPLTGSNNIVLCWPGEDWPKNALNKIVTRYLSEGKRIIVDPDKYDVCWILADSRNELRKLIALHKIKHVYGTIYELYD